MLRYRQCHLLLLAAFFLFTGEKLYAAGLPYATDFTGDTLWTTQTVAGSTWERGLPAYGVTSGAHSPSEAWDVNLTGPVADGTECYLYSPAFAFNHDLNCKLSFWQNRSSEDYFDGFRIDYSLDGTNWLVLGLADDVNGRNWYTRNNIASSSSPAWSGDSHGWIRSEYRLTQLNTYVGNVQFRFVFTANDSVPSVGCSIDDFAIDRAAGYDVALRALLRPGLHVAAGMTDSVQVIVRNVGASQVNSVDVNFSTDGIITFTQQLTVSLAPSEEDTLALQWHYTPPMGSFMLSCFLSDPSDGDRSNDSIVQLVEGLPVRSMPYEAHYELGATDWVTGSATPWSLQPDSSGASSYHWDDSPGVDYAHHTSAYLYSPFMVWNGERNVRCSFIQQCETETGYDGFRLEYSTDGGLSWQTAGGAGEENTMHWYDADDVSSFHGGPAWSGSFPDWRTSRCLLSALDGWNGLVQFRFVLETDGSNSASGVRIDDFRLEPAPAVDLSINRLSTRRPFAPAFRIDTVQVRIRNTGGAVLTDPQVVLQAGVVQRTYTWIGTLPPGFQVDWVLDTLSLAEGPLTLEVISGLPSDGDTLDNARRLAMFGIPTRTLPYNDDLESAVLFADTAFQWQLGKPAYSGMVGASSGANSWNLPGAGSYDSNVRAVLYSPYFDLRGWYNPRLKFNHWFNTQMGFDGGRVECSLDSGVTWSTLGQRNDPLGINWYNTSGLSASGQPGWSGTSGTWAESVYWMPSLSDYQAGPVQFRFVFESDDSVTVDGWSIDDFRLEASPAHSVAPEVVTGLPDPIAPGLPATLQCRVRNTGALPVQEFDLSVYIDDTLFDYQHVILPSPLGNGQSVMSTVPRPWQPLPGGHGITVIATAVQPSDAWLADDTLRLQAGILDTSRIDSSANSWCEDFEGTQPAWLSLDPLTRAWQYQWQFGTPDKPGWNGAFNGGNVWVTGLESPYASSMSCALYTPVFFADSGRCYRFSFQYLLETEQFQDGGTVEYSLDRGWTWQVLGEAGDPAWYNAAYVNGLGLPPVPGFTGLASQWTLASHDLVLAQPAEILFRFRFGSDASVEMNGWAIDQVCFAPVATCTIGIGELSDDESVRGPFPNPATDRAYFDLSQAARDCRVSLYDLGGRAIDIRWQMTAEHRIELDLNGVVPAVYLVRLECPDGVRYRRLVVR